MQVEITAAQIAEAETMDLDKLRQLAVDNFNGIEEKKETKRDSATGKFTAADLRKINDTEVFDTPETIDPDVEAKMDTTDIPVEEPEVHIARQEIDNGDGSGVDVYEAEGATELEAYKNLASKIADGKANANKKIRELSSKVKVQTAEEKQTQVDLDYVLQQRMKTEPAKAIKDLVTEELTKISKAESDKKAQEAAAIQRSLATQQNFVDEHPDYVGNARNGNLVRDWVLARGNTEFTTDNLNKAYEALKTDGLLELKAEGADGATEVKAEVTQRTVAPAVEATQQRSQRRGSTIATGRSAAPKVNVAPTVDEAYAMPLEKLKELANRSLSSH
jgi:glucan-binding YG repeat protein